MKKDTKKEQKMNYKYKERKLSWPQNGYRAHLDSTSTVHSPT